MTEVQHLSMTDRERSRRTEDEERAEFKEIDGSDGVKKNKKKIRGLI